MEGVGSEPALTALCREVPIEVRRLSPGDRGRNGNEEIRPSQIPFVLGDLVLEDQVVPKRLPSQFRDNPVILVPILQDVGEDDVRRTPDADLLQLSRSNHS